MNERAKALVNAPTSVTPQTELTTARDIRAALQRNINGGNYGVYCSCLGHVWRVFGVRTKKGELQIKNASGDWIKPACVYTEG